MRQMSLLPNLGILLSHFSFPSLSTLRQASVASVTDCDLPHLQVPFGAFSGFWFTGVSAQLKTFVVEYLLNALIYYQKEMAFSHI